MNEVRTPDVLEFRQACPRYDRLRHEVRKHGKPARTFLQKTEYALLAPNPANLNEFLDLEWPSTDVYDIALRLRLLQLIQDRHGSQESLIQNLADYGIDKARLARDDQRMRITEGVLRQRASDLAQAIEPINRVNLDDPPLEDLGVPELLQMHPFLNTIGDEQTHCWILACGLLAFAKTRNNRRRASWTAHIAATLMARWTIGNRTKLLRTTLERASFLHQIADEFHAAGTTGTAREYELCVNPRLARYASMNARAAATYAILFFARADSPRNSQKKLLSGYSGPGYEDGDIFKILGVDD